MKVFVTGASGFVGSAVVKDLLENGHQVLGLARSEESAQALEKAGAKVHRGNIEDLESLKSGVSQADAVIHTAFNHDFSRYKLSCDEDRQIIAALGEAIGNSGKPLVVTSGVGLLSLGRIVTEDDSVPSSEIVPRAASEEAAIALQQKGVNCYILRLPPSTHGIGDHGFVAMVADMARKAGESVYVGDGQNRWPAAHRFDAASMYRLIVEKQPQQKIFHAVAEQGVAFGEIAKSIGKELDLPVVSQDKASAEAHFGWFLHFASIDCPASSEKSSATLGWQPKHIGLLDDLNSGDYF
ncbi:SDR family oxidoreductase [Flavobacterium sp.]|uniref:SDR family oxidoreductase n=1 Tax=Flavobacterium sp. TaxID=239 RepID=UPI0011FC5D20|nr:SDR family oxidoreductase [Flavobacterium sp.]RZJ71466.1 MAG: SDR family oxidoreductase [Flavobacterium sp.]